MNPKNHSLLSLAHLRELGLTLKTDITAVLCQGRRGTYHTGSCSQARYASEEVILKDILENEENLLCLCLNQARMLVPQRSETRLHKAHFVGSLSIEEVADAASIFTQPQAFSSTTEESSFEDKIAQFKKSVVALSLLGDEGSSMYLYRPAATLNLFDISDEG